MTMKPITTGEAPPPDAARADRAKPRELEEDLDRQLADTFPASDPPSVTQPALRVGFPERAGTRSG